MSKASTPPFGEAQLRYDDGDYHVIKNGTFVRCAVTQKPIPLKELHYWSVEHQEAYASPQAVKQRFFPQS
jgi:hypothetical protein